MVDGTAFRWVVSHSDIVVQAESGGSMLLVNGVCHKSYDYDRDKYVQEPITPRSIASVIRHSMKSGWKFNAKGPVFKIDVGDLLKYRCPTCKDLVIRNDHPDYECGFNAIRTIMET